MDVRFDIPPRLRLNRHASSFAATIDDSNFHNTFNHERDGSGDGDDDGSTPRLGAAKMSVDTFDEPLRFSQNAQAQSTPAPTREATAAERLRAVLSRANSLTPTVKAQSVPAERTPSNGTALVGSDMESDDFETPRPGGNRVPATPYTQHSISSSVTHSVARESVRSIFAHALRSPGNTPERPRRPRRGSVDSSIVEESPVKWSMLKPGERVKRLSMSDDEKEKIKAADALTENSFRSSQAATYDQLRHRLKNSNVDPGMSKGRSITSITKSDMTIDMEEATEVEQELLRDRQVPVRSTTPPIPSNVTSNQSVSQFPSQFLGSNLLTENSDIRRMIEDSQGETTDSEVPKSNRKDNKTPTAGPPSGHIKARPSLVRERTLSRNGSTGSLSSPNSRPTSRQSMNDIEDEERKRERERGWNHPLGPYMERHRATSPFYSMTHGGGFGRIRNASLSSISGSESDAGRLSPRNSMKQSDEHARSPTGSKYAGIISSWLPSSSSNQIRVSTRIRTVSQPARPGSPGSLASSTNSDKTQKALERPRTFSLTARETTRSSSSLARDRLSSRRSPNGFRTLERSSTSPSLSARPPSRSPSQSSFHQSDGPREHEEPHDRERHWSSPHRKRNTMTSPSVVTEKRRSGSTAHLRTPPTEHSSRVPAPHGSSSSPSGIPRLVVNGRSRTTNHAEIDRENGSHNQKSRNTAPLITNSTSTAVNGKSTSSIKDSDARQPATTKEEHKAHTQREHDRAFSRAESPTVPPEMNGTDESEEDGTPKIGQQRIPDSPTPNSGSRPSSRVGTASTFPSHAANKGNDRVNAVAPTATSRPEKQRYQGDTEQNKGAQPLKVSIPSEPIDLRDSDLDSFQEEDIIASSSAPRLLQGNDSLVENDASSQAEDSPADINLLRPQQDTRMNGHSEVARGKSSLLPQSFSPLSPQIDQPDPVTSTPQRRTSANTSKAEFRTPSPPKGMPALPDPPSSEDDAESDVLHSMQVTPAGRSRFTDVKTPRLPGAWSTPFATPAPPARRSTLPRDTLAEDDQVLVQNEIYTPPASHSRATSMIMKTPAPPGAWLATPGTVAAKRFQQKVRFDEQGNSAAPAPVPRSDDGTLISDISAVDGSVAMKVAGKTKPTSPRTPGRIRVVDAFGNEITPSLSKDKVEIRSVEKAGELHATGSDEKLNASEGRKSRIRVLDALGREIDEVQVLAAMPSSAKDELAKQPRKAERESVTAWPQDLSGRKLERKQALHLLQKTISELKNDFDTTEGPASTQTTDDIDARIADLKAQSIRAKEDREQLLRKIRNTHTEASSPSTAAWKTLLNGKNVFTSSNWSAYFKVFAVLVGIQALLFFAFYHLTSLGARQLFLTTYIDPFYPELYLHVTDPDHLHLSMPSHSNFGLQSSPYNWKYALLASWHAVLDRMLTLKETVWDVWRDPPRSIPWPPT
ncbi:hypothetical protein ACEPAH_6950 [Sanghuangporus vaninii]